MCGGGGGSYKAPVVKAPEEPAKPEPMKSPEVKTPEANSRRNRNPLKIELSAGTGLNIPT